MDFRKLFKKPAIGIFVVMTIFADTNSVHAQVVSGSINGHDYVDLGLSVKWATCNVGANSPEEYGDYYAWGETSTKTTYDEDNSRTFGKNSYNFDIAGNVAYDAARVNWGGTWRLPTDVELLELVEKCAWTHTIQGYNSYGYLITGPNGNSIFLPAAGYYGTSFNLAGSFGLYWSSTPYCKGKSKKSKETFRLYFNDRNSKGVSASKLRHSGMPIRPVSE